MISTERLIDRRSAAGAPFLSVSGPPSREGSKLVGRRGKIEAQYVSVKKLSLERSRLAKTVIGYYLRRLRLP